MLHSTLLSLLVSTTIGVSTASGASDSLVPRDTGGGSPRIPLAVPSDTPRARPRAIEVSDWYGRRLTIHRYLSYSVIPVFGAQWVAGNQIYTQGREAPAWAKTTHRAGATALAGIFTVNTVTGLWNLWDSRSVSQGRTLRTVHALSMLAADAGFTYAGVKLSKEAEVDFEKRRQHRTIALSSMAVATVSGIVMKLYNK